MFTLKIPVATRNVGKKQTHFGDSFPELGCDPTYPLTERMAADNIGRLQGLFDIARQVGNRQLHEILDSVPGVQERQGPMFWYCSEQQFNSDVVPFPAIKCLRPPIPMYPRSLDSTMWCPSSYSEAEQVLNGLDFFCMRSIVVTPVYNSTVFNSVPTGFLMTPLDGAASVLLDYRQMALDVFKVQLLFKNCPSFFILWSSTDLIALKSTFGVTFFNVLVLRYLLVPCDVLQETEWDLPLMAAVHFGKFQVNMWAQSRKAQNSLTKNLFVAMTSREWLFNLATLYITIYENTNNMVMAINRSGPTNEQRPALAVDTNRMIDSENWNVPTPSAAMHLWTAIEGIRTGWKPEQLIPPPAFNMAHSWISEGKLDGSWKSLQNSHLNHLSQHQCEELKGVLENLSLEYPLKRIVSRKDGKLLEAIRRSVSDGETDSRIAREFGTTKEEVQRGKDFYRLDHKLEDCDETNENSNYFRYRAIVKGQADHTVIWHTLLLWCVPSDFSPEKERLAGSGCVLFGTFAWML